MCRGLQFVTDGIEARGQERGEGGRYYLFLTNKINEGNETRLNVWLAFAYDVYSEFDSMTRADEPKWRPLGLVILGFVEILTKV